jgi:hypothetical protein
VVGRPTRAPLLTAGAAVLAGDCPFTFRLGGALAPLAGGAALALSPPDADDGTNGLWAAVGDED